MRKIFGLLTALCYGVCAYGAAPWGAMADYDLKFENLPVNSNFSGGYRYLLPQIIAGKPVRVFLSVPADTEDNLAEYQESIRQNYNQWFESTAQIIRATGREAEFADVLPLLDKGIKVEFLQDKEQVDIRFYVVPFAYIGGICGAMAGGCYKRLQQDGEIPEIFLPQDQVLLKLLSAGKLSSAQVGLHEIGHSLGLSDQYEKAKDKDTPRRYSSARPAESVMNRDKNLSCDDADGIVNLIDIARGTARGGDKGWKSLCANSKEYYVRGQSGLRGPYQITSEDTRVWDLEVYKNGQVAYTKHLELTDKGAPSPFVVLPQTVQERDGLGRPVLAVGPNGEKIYYAYLYDQYIKLITIGGKAVQGELYTPFWENRTRGNARGIYFKKGKNWGVLGVMKNKRGGEVFYTLKDENENLILDMSLAFDKQNQLLSEKYNDGKQIFSNSTKSRGSTERMLAQQVAAQVERAQWDKLKEQLTQWYLNQPEK